MMYAMLSLLVVGFATGIAIAVNALKNDDLNPRKTVNKYDWDYADTVARENARIEREEE
jgi:hypothetical protein